MLSYRHVFHAGNHADLLKHTVLTLILQNLQKKEKPCSFIDTHSGAGLYRLDDERALKTGENAGGILRLLNSPEFSGSIPDEILPYITLCRKYAEKNQYPGSPEIFRNYLRPQDKLTLIELHNTEIEVLKGNMEPYLHSGQIAVHHRDAYEAVNALLPPDPRRGLLLMDPSYEVSSDYENAARSLIAAHKRWPVGILCLWYPLLVRRASELSELKNSLKEAAELSGSSFLTAELIVDGRGTTPDEPSVSEDGGYGLYGSGMAIINAPWQLDESLKKALPYLTQPDGTWSVDAAYV